MTSEEEQVFLHRQESKVWIKYTLSQINLRYFIDKTEDKTKNLQTHTTIQEIQYKPHQDKHPPKTRI